MIKVTIELISARGRKYDQTLGVAKISNDGQETMFAGDPLGAYEVTLSKWAPKLDETWKRGKVVKFDRKARGPWDLLYRCLRALVGMRNPDPIEATPMPPQLRLWCSCCMLMQWSRPRLTLDGNTSLPTGFVYECRTCASVVGDDGGIWDKEAPPEADA